MKLGKEFYESDSISRLMPGKKDCVSMKVDRRKVPNLKKDIMCIYDDLTVEEISYKAWVSVAHTALETLTKKTEDFVDALLGCLAALRKHDFIAKQ